MRSEWSSSLCLLRLAEICSCLDKAVCVLVSSYNGLHVTDYVTPVNSNQHSVLFIVQNPIEAFMSEE